MTGRSPEEKAAWETARTRVASYHGISCRSWSRTCGSALGRLDVGDIDVFEFDDVVHQHKKAAQKLRSFCSGTERDIAFTARLLDDEHARGQIRDWRQLAARRHGPSS